MSQEPPISGAASAVAAGAPRERRSTFAQSTSIGMALFVFTEAMLFAGFISAFAIVQSNAPVGAWPPPDQPRLPVERTLLNTAALLLSGVALFVAGRFRRAGSGHKAAAWMGLALALGSFFVVAQGMEWAALLRQGLTLTSSQLGSFFYLIIGTHALHAVAAIVALAVAWRNQAAGTLTDARFGGIRMFWYFVVLVWPVLYWQVYL